MGFKYHSATSKLTGSLQMLIMLMLPLFVLAQQEQPPPPNNNPPDNHSANLTWERIVAGFILLLIGIILTFRGYRHYRFTVFLAGFITGCVIVYSIFTNVEPDQGWNHSQVIYVFGCIGGGLIIGAICWLFTPFLVWILGGVAGLAVALYVLAWRNQGLIRAKGGRIGLLIGAPVLGLIIALVLGRKILIPASVIVGAYLTVAGIDLFARTGFIESIQKFFTTDSKVDYKLTTNMYIMLGVIGGLIVLGLVFQILSWRHRRQALIAQGRPLHDEDNDWSVFGRKNQSVRPDSTYSNTYGASGYNAGYNNSGYNNPGYNSGYHPGYNNNVDHNNVDETVYTEKRNWNPFKKNKEVVTTTAATTAATTAPAAAAATSSSTDYPEDNRVSYSSNAALVNQNQ